jgi:hypothetical protein
MPYGSAAPPLPAREAEISLAALAPSGHVSGGGEVSDFLLRSIDHPPPL